LCKSEGEPKEREGVAVSIFPTKILLASDGSEEAELALKTAVDLTNNTNSELHVVTVGGAEYRHGYDIPESGDLLRETYKTLEREAQETLDEQVKKIEEAGGTVTEAHLRTGRAAEEIVALGEEIGAGLIIIGSRGRGGIRRTLMGSVSDSVIRHAHCPVLVVRSEERLAEERRVARGA
jgi:nucleotide-binding universal stress UspA family protein